MKDIKDLKDTYLEPKHQITLREVTNALNKILHETGHSNRITHDIQEVECRLENILSRV